MTAWNPEKVRQDFVLLRNTDRVYFDNAATSQKPQCVLDAVEEFYQKYNANVLRGLYPLSVEATERYEAARRTVQRFIHAACPEEIIFTRNATESMNLVAYSYGMANLKAGDEIRGFHHGTSQQHLAVADGFPCHRSKAGLSGV